MKATLNEQIYNRYLLSEELKQEVQQKFQQQVQQPETVAAMQKQAQALYDQYKDQLEAAKQKDGGKENGPAVTALLKKIEQELAATASKTIKESASLDEGWFDRVRSNASGAVSRVKDVMNATPSDKGYKQHAILKRFQILQNTIGKDLRELQRDLETTSNIDTKVKDAVAKTISNLETKHNIAPVQSKLGDIRHKIGNFAQNVGIGAALAAPIVAAAGPLAAAVGLTGAGAAAATAGVSAGSVSMLKDLIYGQKPNPKRAATAAVLAAGTAGLLKYAADGGFSGQGQAAPSSDVPVAKPDMSHADVGNTMHNDPTYNPVGEIGKHVDITKDEVSKVLWDKGIIGKTSGNVAIPSPAVQNYLDDLIQNPDTRNKAIELLDKLKAADPEKAREIFSWGARKAGNIEKLFDKL